ncbi:lipase maturation factor 2-like [Ptychodera flava]|uniref:lipase maturation factor 2-like n=1 Tax=Ptychodera flava TaxID=63121 RepID=UPI003969BDFD
MAEIKLVRDFYLWCVSAIYLFAFASLYNQIPGLYGNKGLLPAHLVLKEDGRTPEDSFKKLPTLLWFAPRIGLDIDTTMDLICLLGIAISLISMISKTLRDTCSFVIMWFLYFSMYQVGQTFLWFQWDILLLEVGFLTILVAPFNLLKWKPVSHYQHDRITMWLVKWLLFRLMFASGIVKLTSQCPTWWGLTALTYHYETQCIATPLAWYAHQLPVWFQKLSVVFTYVIEIALPFLFFSPVRSMRIFGGISQVFLMILILLTGNYNFFNVLTAVLCLSTLDDDFFSKSKAGATSSRSVFQIAVKVLVKASEIVVYGGLVYWTVKLFSLHIDTSVYGIESKIAFTLNEFLQALRKIMPVTVWMGIASLAFEIIYALGRCLYNEEGLLKKVWSIFLCLLFSSAAVFMFAISLVPHSVVDDTARQNVWPIVHRWHSKTSYLHLTNSYGLFRRMTGVGGRPEVIIEGSYDLNQWKAYDFLYKPGNVSEAPPVVAPHQPRLDWQMWFAALGSYNHNPWFLNLIYRLLNNEPDVIALIAKNPFPDKPPKYIRAELWHYYFTRIGKNTTLSTLPKNWWRRKFVREYLPALTLKDESFIKYLTQQGIIEKKSKMQKKKKESTNILKSSIVTVRSHIGSVEGFTFVMSLFTAGLFIKMVRIFFDKKT